MNVTSLTGLTGTSSLSTQQTLLASQSSSQSDSSARTSSGPPPPPSSASGGSDAQSLFEALAAMNDRDGDGTLSQSEFDQGPVANVLSDLFSKVDSDGDGLWSETEMEAAADALQGAVAERRGATGAAGDPQSLYQSVFDALMADESSRDTTSTSTASDRERVGQFLDLLSKIG